MKIQIERKVDRQQRERQIYIETDRRKKEIYINRNNDRKKDR